MTIGSQIEQVASYQQELLLKAQRGALPDDFGAVDPEDGWPYNDRPGFDDPQIEQRRGYSADELSMTDFQVGRLETVCGKCHYLHRRDRACEDVW